MAKMWKGASSDCNLGNGYSKKLHCQIKHPGFSPLGGNLPRLVGLIKDKVLRLGTSANEL